MTTVAPRSFDILEPALSPKRRLVNILATTWMVGSLLVAIVPLVVIVVYVISRGARSRRAAIRPSRSWPGC